MFEPLVQDVSSRTGLSSVAATDLVRAVTARLIHNPAGGFAPFLATIRDRGQGDLVAHWLGDDPKAGAVSPDEAEAILGAEYVDETSRSLGITRDEVRIGSAIALPSVAHELTPGGMVPAADELERGYAGWAGGHVSVTEAPIAGFPTEPSPLHRGPAVEMELSRPAPEIKAKAIDGPATLLPWLVLFILLPVLSVVTCNLPRPAAEHGGGHGAATHGAAAGEHGGAAGEHGAGEHGAGETAHEEPGMNPNDSPTQEPGRNEAETQGSPRPEAGDAATGNTAAPGSADPANDSPGDAIGRGPDTAPGTVPPGTAPSPTEPYPSNAPANAPTNGAGNTP